MRRLLTSRHWSSVAGPLLLLFLAVFGNGQRVAAQSQPQPPSAGPPTAPPASYSDPRVIAELEKSCAFDPDRLSAEQATQWLGRAELGRSAPLSCHTPIEQSCVYDPCWDSEQDSCRPRCAKRCTSCGQECASGCEQCKAACQDTACRHACAERCASCRQDCLRSRDRCTTGTCSSEYRQCRRKQKADWLRNDCKAVCQQYLACQRPCIRKHERKGDSYEACTKPCEPKELRGCKMIFCGGNFGMGIDPTSAP